MAVEKEAFPEDSAAPVYIYQAAIEDKLAKTYAATDQDLKNALYDEETSIVTDMDLKIAWWVVNKLRHMMYKQGFRLLFRTTFQKLLFADKGKITNTKIDLM